MMNVLSVFIGGGLGALSRWALTLIGSRAVEGYALARGWEEPRSSVALATLAINLVGCFVIGVAYGVFERKLPRQATRLLVMTGFLGGFTTFSTYALELATALRDGRGAGGIVIALAANLGGLTLALLGVALGDLLGRSLDPLA